MPRKNSKASAKPEVRKLKRSYKKSMMLTQEVEKTLKPTVRRRKKLEDTLQGSIKLTRSRILAIEE